MIGFIFWIIAKVFSTSTDAKKSDHGVDYNAISKQIDKLQKDKEKLAEIENLITDLEAAADQETDEGNFYEFRWRDITGTEHQYEFLIFSDDREQKNLMEIAKTERERVRTSLTLEIKDLRSCVTKPSRKGVKNHDRG